HCSFALRSFGESILAAALRTRRLEARMEGLAACFEDLADPRTGNAGRHDLIEIMVIALCTVLCGGQYASDMAMFAREKEAFLRQFLKLEKGLPSHDTFSRVFRLLDPEQFSACFQKFMGKFSQACHGVIAIDGKVLRRSFDKASGKSPLHMVSAWGCDQRLVLAQIATDAKSNEITAVPQLLKLLSLKGTIVTVDALNCQRAIAQQIIDQGGDYAFALKGNQGTLHTDVAVFLDDPLTKATTEHTTVDADHGRIETRGISVSTDIDWLQERHRWPGLEAIGKVTRTRETGDKISTETAYYLFSTPITADHGRTRRRSRAQPLGRREPFALAPRRDHERRCRSKPHGQRAAQSGRAPPHGAQRHGQGGKQDIPTRKIQKSRVESRLSRQTPR